MLAVGTLRTEKIQYAASLVTTPVLCCPRLRILLGVALVGIRQIHASCMRGVRFYRCGLFSSEICSTANFSRVLPTTNCTCFTLEVKGGDFFFTSTLSIREIVAVNLYSQKKKNHDTRALRTPKDLLQVANAKATVKLNSAGLSAPHKAHYIAGDCCAARRGSRGCRSAE